MPSPPHPEGLTVIVPTFDEAKNLPLLVDRLVAALPGRALEILVVDDASPDGTAAVARALPQVRVLERQERGLATAVVHGLRNARHDLCVTMDADLSHPPEQVAALALLVERGAPLALGSRYAHGGQTVGWGPARWLNSWLATALARPFTQASDPMSGFFCVRKSAVPFEALEPTGYKIALELLVKCGVRHPAELPIVFTERAHGRSKLSLSVQLAYLRQLLRLTRWRWAQPASRPSTVSSSS